MQGLQGLQGTRGAHHSLVDLVDDTEGRDGDAGESDQVQHGAHAALAAALPHVGEHLQRLVVAELDPGSNEAGFRVSCCPSPGSSAVRLQGLVLSVSRV